MLIKDEISDINACIRRYHKHYTLLTTASMLGQIDCVKALLEYGANEDILCEIFFEVFFASVSAIYLASFKGHIEIVKVLLEHGTSLNSPTCSPLCGACLAGDLELAKFLVDLGADVNHSSVLNPSLSLSTNPLAAAARNGSIELIEYLISKGADIHCDGDNQNALIEACFFDRYQVMEALLRYGASINVCTEDPFKSSCMHVAGFDDNMEMFKFLLARGADVNACNVRATPLEIAFDRGNDELMALLLDHGADPDMVRYESPLTLLMSAAANNSISTMKLLLKYGADINSTVQVRTRGLNWYIKVSTPLLVACKHGCVSALRFLLEHGADVNQIFNQYEQNDTSLICIFRTRSWSKGQHQRLTVDVNGDIIDLWPDQLACLKLLLEHGADVTVLNSEGKTVFDYVKDRPGVIRLLNEASMDTKPILK